MGGGFFGIPKKVIESPAYRDLSVHARAVLIEIGARMDGFNNGKVGMDQRRLREAIGCSPRKVVQALAELVEHGFVEVMVEGRWTEKMAREYRLCFVSTPGAPATNDYLRWLPGDTASGRTRKLSVTDAVAAKAVPATDAVTATRNPATDAVTARIRNPQKSVNCLTAPVTDAVAHIVRPFGRDAGPGQGEPDQRATSLSEPYSAAGHRSASVTDGDGEGDASAFRSALSDYGNRAGLIGLATLADAAGLDRKRVQAFVAGKDLLSPALIALLSRELHRREAA